MVWFISIPKIGKYIDQTSFLSVIYLKKKKNSNSMTPKAVTNFVQFCVLIQKELLIMLPTSTARKIHKGN